jgi:hypothetical protein
MVWPVIALAVLLLGPMLYLVMLLEGIASPWWAVEFGAGTNEALTRLAPFVLVLSFGAVVGLAEVTAAFPRDRAAALLAPWGVIVLLLNALGLAIAYGAIDAYAPWRANRLLVALLVGLGATIAMRTRLVLARSVRGNQFCDDLSIDVGMLYGRFQQVALERIEAHLLRRREELAEHLLSRYPDARLLRGVAEWSIRRSVSGVEADALLAQIDEILAVEAPAPVVLLDVANRIVELGGSRAASMALRSAQIAPLVFAQLESGGNLWTDACMGTCPIMSCGLDFENLGEPVMVDQSAPEAFTPEASQHYGLSFLPDITSEPGGGPATYPTEPYAYAPPVSWGYSAPSGYPQPYGQGSSAYWPLRPTPLPPAPTPIPTDSASAGP